MVRIPKPLSESERRELYSPIRRVINALMTEDDQEALAKDVRIRKLALLLREYKIASDLKQPWFVLSYLLAKNHHPGFKLEVAKKRRGRHTRWDYPSQQQLLNDIQIIINDLRSKSPGNRGRWTIMAACDHAKSRFPGRYRGITKESLAARYHEANRALKKIRAEFPSLIDNNGNYGAYYRR